MYSLPVMNDALEGVQSGVVLWKLLKSAPGSLECAIECKQMNHTLEKQVYVKDKIYLRKQVYPSLEYQQNSLDPRETLVYRPSVFDRRLLFLNFAHQSLSPKDSEHQRLESGPIPIC